MTALSMQPALQTLQMGPAANQLAKVQAQSTSTHKMLSAKQMARIDSSAKDFEAVYATEMLKPMFSTVKTDALFGGGQSEETYRGLMLQEYGKQIASKDQLGLAKYVKAELIKLQEGQK